MDVITDMVTDILAFAQTVSQACSTLRRFFDTSVLLQEKVWEERCNDKGSTYFHLLPPEMTMHIHTYFELATFTELT